jgi:hypothetical protein
MANNELYRITLLREAFTSLEGEIPLELFKAKLLTLPLTVPITDVRRSPSGNAIVLEWFGDPPSVADRGAVNDAAAAFVGGVTTAAPLAIESLGITQATTSALVTVLDATTPPRDGGTYAFSWNCLVGMVATVANTGVRGVFTASILRGQTIISRQWEHNWTMQQPQHFGSTSTFECEAGDRIQVLLQVAKVGVAAATAQMAVCRITVDQLAPKGV